jgi:ADP-heptose:LPS heptosyltransferase
MQTGNSFQHRGKRLLILHQGALGDFIVTFPVLALLRDVFAGVDAVCRSSFGPAAVHLGIVDDYRSVEAAGFATIYTDAPSPRWADWLSSYERILLFSFSEELAQRLRTHAGTDVYRIPPWPRNRQHVQVTEFLWDRLLTADFLTEKEKERLREARRRVWHAPRRGPDSKRVFLGPGAGSVSKRWPLASFLKLAALLARKGFEPIFLLGPLEGDIAVQLADPSRSPFPVTRPENLIDLIDLLKTAGGYVGNDSAVGHLAAFLGLATVIVFGPSNPACWRPWGPRVGIVQAEMDCRPCAPQESTGCNHRDCLQSITPRQVCAAFVDVVGRCGDTGDTLDG